MSISPQHIFVESQHITVNFINFSSFSLLKCMIFWNIMKLNKITTLYENIFIDINKSVSTQARKASATVCNSIFSYYFIMAFSDVSTCSSKSVHRYAYWIITNNTICLPIKHQKI